LPSASALGAFPATVSALSSTSLTCRSLFRDERDDFGMAKNGVEIQREGKINRAERADYSEQ
jgi:hypothetical protein